MKAMNQYWHLMTMANCVMLPPNSVVFTYLNLHLRRCCLLGHTEEGKFSQFCLKVQLYSGVWSFTCGLVIYYVVWSFTCGLVIYMWSGHLLCGLVIYMWSGHLLCGLVIYVVIYMRSGNLYMIPLTVPSKSMKYSCLA